MEEEAREPPCEVGQETFGHRTDLSLDVVGQVLVMMFLSDRAIRHAHADKAGKLTLLRRARMRSCTDRPSYLRYLPRFSMNHLSNRAFQSLPTTLNASLSSSISIGSRGSRHIISKRSDASWRKLRRLPGSQKYGCNRHVGVSGLA